MTDCGFSSNNCNEDNTCPLHEKYATIREAILKLVLSETIRSLAKKNAQNFMIQSAF